MKRNPKDLATPRPAPVTHQTSPVAIGLLCALVAVATNTFVLTPRWPALKDNDLWQGLVFVGMTLALYAIVSFLVRLVEPKRPSLPSHPVTDVDPPRPPSIKTLRTSIATQALLFVGLLFLWRLVTGRTPENLQALETAFSALFIAAELGRTLWRMKRRR